MFDAQEGDWVQIHDIVLEVGKRAPNLPQETQEVPLELRVRGFLLDKEANPSGSFKARRAAVSVYHAQKHGYNGVVAATSGNYGAAVASQAAKRGLKAIIVQEVYDSRGM